MLRRQDASDHTVPPGADAPLPAGGPAATGPPDSPRSVFGPTEVAMFVVLAFVWGLSFLFIKVSVGALSPLWVVAVRTSIGGAVLLAILRARGQRLPRGRTVWLHLTVLATVGNAVPWALVAWAQQTVPSGLAAVVNSLIPASTLVVAAAVGIESLTTRRIFGLLLAMAGTAVVVGGEIAAPDRLVGLLIIAGATVMYGGASVYAKRYVSHSHRPLAIAAGQVLLAGAFSIPVAALVGPTPVWSELSPQVIGAMTVLGAFGTGIAFLLYYTLIERVGATNSTMVTYLMPVIGLSAGALVLGESFGLHVLIGGAIVIVGIWLAQRASARRPAPSTADTGTTSA